MTRIQLVISDVDGTLVTTDKRLTDRACAAVKELREAGIGFTLTSSRPPVGMRMFSDPLGIDLPLGPFNGSSIVAPDLQVIEQHLIPKPAVLASLDVLDHYGVDIWLFSNDQWYIRREDGAYVAHEQHTVRFDPTLIEDFAALADRACKIVGVSADFAVLERCEGAMQRALGNTAVAARSQTYYLDITPPGQDKGSFVTAMSKRLGIPTAAIATIGDMQNDVPMFKVAGLPIAMGNATADVQRFAEHVTGSNEDDGFAGAVAYILKRNAQV